MDVEETAKVLYEALDKTTVDEIVTVVSAKTLVQELAEALDLAGYELVRVVPNACPNCGRERKLVGKVHFHVDTDKFFC